MTEYTIPEIPEALDTDVFITRAFNAPREVVWKFFTEPELLAQWFGPETVHVDPSTVNVQLHPGGRWDMDMVDNETGEHYPIRSQLNVVIPPEYLEGGEVSGADVDEPGRQRSRCGSGSTTTDDEDPDDAAPGAVHAGVPRHDPRRLGVVVRQDRRHPRGAEVTTEYAKSSDGTRIAFESNGSGPVLVLVDGAMCYRRFGPAEPFTAALGDAYTVVTYDRRGRGESGDSSTYRPELEFDDLRAVIDAVGGKPYVLGFSSGAGLAYRAAAAGVPMAKLDRLRGAVRRPPRRPRLRQRPRPPHRRRAGRQGRRLLHGEDGRRSVLRAR